MKSKMINQTHIEGKIYESKLELKESGPNSKHPGTQFISGNLDIATDDDLLNIVTVHFTYVTEKTAKGNVNSTFTVLKNIVDGNVGTVTTVGPEEAGMIQIDSAIGLNDFYTDRDGVETLVSAKRNEGGFVHLVTSIDDDEKRRNTFKCDIVITNVRDVEADEERGLPAKAIIKGAIFDFRKSLLPVEFSAINPNAISYFQSLEASPSNPVFTSIWGRQISETVVKKIVTESAFGEDEVREVKNTHKDWVVTGAAREEYLWDSEDTITADELRDAMKERELYLSEVKQRSDEYKASKNSNSGAKEAEFKF